MRPQGSFIHPAGAMKWFWGRHLVKSVLLPIDSIMDVVNVWPRTVAPIRLLRARELFIVMKEKVVEGVRRREERLA